MRINLRVNIDIREADAGAHGKHCREDDGNDCADDNIDLIYYQTCYNTKCACAVWQTEETGYPTSSNQHINIMMVHDPFPKHGHRDNNVESKS